MKYTCFFLLSIFLFPLGHSQNRFPDKEPVFVDHVVPRIDIVMPQDSLDILFAPGNEESDYHWHATFIFDNTEIKDTVENVGFRFRGNTSRQSAKKSFKVSFNTYEQGRKFYGLEKLNLNGEHNDPSVIRSKISWDLLRELKVPAPRANHIELYINGEYFGLYINVEHIDEEFVDQRFGSNEGNLYKCLWPADLNYLGPNPDSYKGFQSGRRTYDLLTNRLADDYSDLAHFIDVLNNTSILDFPCELEKVFNVDSYLRALVYDIFGANWDGPVFNKNNFYLYHNTETGQFEYIPFDLDNTFGIDWFIDNLATRDIYDWAHPSEPRPIYTRILAVQEYKDRFTYYFNEFLEGAAANEVLLLRILEIRDMIASSAERDTYRTRDYGFSFHDFFESYENRLGTHHVRYGLLEYISRRHTSAKEQFQLNDIFPLVRDVDLDYPNAQGNINVRVEIDDDNGAPSLLFCYTTDDMERLDCVELFDDGQNGDKKADDEDYSGVILLEEGAELINWYVEVTDSVDQVTRYPRCETKTFPLLKNDISLFINEIMADNDTTLTDEAGEYDDWIEIYNASNQAIWLGDKFLSDKFDNPDKWAFPDTSIEAGAFMLFWADEDGSQGKLHTNFKLEKNGEFVGIFDSETNDFRLIDGIVYGEQKGDTTFGRFPNGTGDFQIMLPTPEASNSGIVGLESEYLVENFTIFPNPSQGEIIVRWDNVKLPRANMKLELLDLLGRKVDEKSIHRISGEIRWQPRIIQKGLYFVRLINHHKQVAIRKVLFE